MDLMPLVKDDVATSDSCGAVKEHIAACEACRQVFETTGQVAAQMNEKVVVKRMKQQLTLAALMMVILGALLGVGVSDSNLIFYNIVIMPAIGALGYIALRQRSYLVPLAMLPFVYIWYFVKHLLSGELSYQVLVFSPLFWGLIYAGLCALGVIVAALLGFAFRKEDRSDANIN
jgi:hypothetical protein